jgi:hypothetical protein
LKTAISSHHPIECVALFVNSRKQCVVLTVAFANDSFYPMSLSSGETIPACTTVEMRMLNSKVCIEYEMETFDFQQPPLFTSSVDQISITNNSQYIM